MDHRRLSESGLPRPHFASDVRSRGRAYAATDLFLHSCFFSFAPIVVPALVPSHGFTLPLHLPSVTCLGPNSRTRFRSSFHKARLHICLTCRTVYYKPTWAHTVISWIVLDFPWSLVLFPTLSEVRLHTPMWQHQATSQQFYPVILILVLGAFSLMVHTKMLHILHLIPHVEVRDHRNAMPDFVCRTRIIEVTIISCSSSSAPCIIDGLTSAVLIRDGPSEPEKKRLTICGMKSVPGLEIYFPCISQINCPQIRAKAFEPGRRRERELAQRPALAIVEYNSVRNWCPARFC